MSAIQYRSKFGGYQRRFGSFLNHVFLVRLGVGLGDALMLSCVASETKKMSPNVKIHVFSRFPELFLHNPDVDSSHRLPKRLPTRFLRHVKLPGLFFVNYEWVEYPPKHHILSLCCASVGLGLREDPHPKVVTTEDEREKTKIAFGLERGKYLVIQSEGGTDWFAGNKDWGGLQWQEVTESLQDDWTIVQVGNLSDLPLEGTIDLRGKTTVREAACILESARLFIGQEGGLHHLAAAVDTPAVLVIGGLQPADYVSYPENANIVNCPECSPCWLSEKCPHQKKCMTSISVDAVVDDISKKLDQL